MGKLLLIIFVAVILSLGFSKNVNQSNEVIAIQETIPKNETQTSVSPDGKYRAEAYGTNTGITAGGLYPYEGIRIVSTKDDAVLWEMEPGYYVVYFSWSPDSRYGGIYYEARIWGQSVVFDIKEKKLITLPYLNDIAPHYDAGEKPQENRPDPYFKISGWENAETVIVDFRWTKEDGEYFSGQFTYDLAKGTVNYK